MLVIDEAITDVATGTLGVVTVMTLPKATPTEFCEMAQM